MAIDLSALEEKPISKQPKATQQTQQQDGRPLRIKLVDIEPDPNQPRIEKNPEEIAEIGENIKQRGVKQPISIKRHPSKPNKWIINDGELRYLGSKFAGVDDIPVVVDGDFDDFDQVNANEKRFALRPMELAKFVQRKLDEGVKKGQIARRLGKPPNSITELLALIDAPVYIDAIYTSGRCRSPKTIYELRSLAEKFPDQVEQWCATSGDITRRTVADLSDTLKGDSKKKIVKTPINATDISDSSVEDDNEQPREKFRHDEISNSEAASSKNAKIRHDEQSSIDEHESDDSWELTSWPREKSAADSALKKPLLLINHDGRVAAVLLNRKPSADGLIRIRYQDGGDDDEVKSDLCTVMLLSEGKR